MCIIAYTTAKMKIVQISYVMTLKFVISYIIARNEGRFYQSRNICVDTMRLSLVNMYDNVLTIYEL